MQIVDIDFCVPEDLKSLVAIEEACFNDPWSELLIEYDLNNPGNAIYMKAIMKRTIVGYGVLGLLDETSHLMNLAVMPEFRRHGAALQLMAAFGELSRSNGCKRMRLEVRSSNITARRFYASMGFVYSSRLKSYYSDGEDALLLVSRLPIKIK
ncbi:MAG: ribosomal protein S18-alanine N-acetyltransferase [Synergistaceae bacterium]|jgi:ribosomal-protein-alanine N-acetyltransferase|nr:ribosomal protein S18-alanine N-acetyltransferase [Synergistaceae bacterium]